MHKGKVLRPTPPPPPPRLPFIGFSTKDKAMARKSLFHCSNA